MNLEFSIIVFMITIMSGDVEPNPGPYSELDKCFSVIHLNIRSIRNKIDYIKNNFTDFDVMCFTETHLSDVIPCENITIEEILSFRKYISNRSGGLLTYISTDLVAKRRTDLEHPTLQSLWTEIKH